MGYTLRYLAITSIALISLILVSGYSVAEEQPTAGFTDGSVITLECLGHETTGDIFLDGDTVTGEVGLVSSTGGGYTGTRWKISKAPNNTITLHCLGNVVRDAHKFLEGNTSDGRVKLGPSVSSPGTRWSVYDGGDGAIMLKCFGAGENFFFLDGDTKNKSVRLAPNDNGSYSGTRWQVYIREIGAGDKIRLHSGGRK